MSFCNPFIDRKEHTEQLSLPENHLWENTTLRIRRNKKKTKERIRLSTHPFRTVKLHHESYYFLYKVKEKAEAEMGFSFLVYSPKEDINIVEIEKLADAMKG